MINVYGISNCDTVKKAIKWLEGNQIEHTFHDFRKDGCDEALVSSFFNAIDWEKLVNKRSTTFRNLPDDVKQNLDKDTAFKLVLEQPTLIKRPVMVNNENYTVGFSEKTIESFISN